MRAMTVRQPYAWAIMHGGKTVENRSRNIAGSYRGPIAITSSRGADVDALADPGIVIAVTLRKLFGPDDCMASNSPPGAILGVVDLVDVHLSDVYAEVFDLHHERSGQCSPWALQDSWHLMLANPRPLPTPIPVRGRLGLWTLPDDVAAQVEETLR